MPRSLKSNGGLGKGLTALLNTADNSLAHGKETEIDISLIDPNPYQPRKFFAEDALATLMESIRQYGVVQPVVLRKAEDGRYQLVAGERRWRACTALKMKKIPAIIKDYSTEEVTEIALVENLQRQDLDPIEEAFAYKKLMETFKQTQEVIAARLGRSRSHVANMVRLLQLPEFLQNELSAGEVTIGQVRPLLTLKNKKLQEEALQIIKEKELNARQVESLVKKLVKPKTDGNKKTQEIPEVKALNERLKLSLGTPVAIKLRAGKKIQGKIEVSFSSEAELNRIIEYLEANTGNPVDEDSIEEMKFTI